MSCICAYSSCFLPALLFVLFLWLLKSHSKVFPSRTMPFSFKFLYVSRLYEWGAVPVPELRFSGQRLEGHQSNQTTPRLAVLSNSTENLLVGACGAGGGLFVLQGHDGDSDAFVPSDNGVSVLLRKRALHAAGAHVCCGRYRTRSLTVC